MAIRIEICTTSIAACLDTVKALRETGIPKEDILIITNHASRDTILNNYDLRREDGTIFSAHSLVENVKGIMTVPEYEAEAAPTTDSLDEYKERIGFGSMVVAVEV